MDLIPLNKAGNDLLLRLFGPAAKELGDILGDVIGLVGDRVSVTRRENLRRILERAAQKSQRDTVIHPVPLSVAVPLLEAASLCGDEGSLKEYWASLVAGAADGALEQTSYIHILGEMSGVDAVVFSAISQAWDREDEFRAALRELNAPQVDSVQLSTNITAVDARREPDGNYRCAELRLTLQQFTDDGLAETVDNLLRLYLVRTRFGRVRDKSLALESPICFVGGMGLERTALGRGFWRRCNYSGDDSSLASKSEETKG